MNSNNQFDVIIIGAGPGGIFSAYELMQKKPDLKVAVFESGYSLTENITSPMTLAELYTNISAKKKPLI